MRHTYSNLLIHTVFSTKGREPLITSEIKDELFAYMGGIIARLGGKSVLANGMPDHVHLLFEIPARASVADFMEKVKANSSKWVHERWSNHRGFAWQAGYAAFSISRSNIPQVRDYIASQEKHHQRRTFAQELIALLKNHKVEYDPRFLADDR
jgi:REP-associated tyrosine transposase